jgi:hypothetical protein
MMVELFNIIHIRLRNYSPSETTQPFLELGLALPSELVEDGNLLGRNLGWTPFVPSNDDTPKEVDWAAVSLELAVTNTAVCMAVVVVEC